MFLSQRYRQEDQLETYSKHSRGEEDLSSKAGSAGESRYKRSPDEGLGAWMTLSAEH